jgi:peptide/nickel transport system substrate-binding protein
MAEPWGNPGLPVLDPWVARDDGSSGVLHLERNPYYWQVDAQGNQLPYIDGIEVTVAADIETCLRKAAAGEVDIQIADIAGAATRSRLDESAASGDYRLVDVEPMHANIHTIFLNRTTPDAERARLFGDIRFREALSLAVDREGINQAIHGGRCRPSQVAPPAGSPAYDAEAAALYTEHDIESANALLDEVGLSWDAKHERRLGADGQPIVLTVVVHLSWPPGQEDAMAMVRDDWREIGIELQSTVLGREEWLELMRTEDWELSSYATNTGGGAYLYLSSDGVFPLDGYWFPAPEWGAWLSSCGTTGREPPAEVKKLYALYEEYVGTASGEIGRAHV